MSMRRLMEAVLTPAENFVARVKGMNLPARLTAYALDAKAVELTDLEAAEPGNGQGRATMTAILALADELGVTLELEPVWDESVKGALYQDHLENWYRRLGFRSIPNRDTVNDPDWETDRYLVRAPR